jgi:outer membrane protein TolC
MLLCLAVCCNSQTITLYDAVTNAVKNYPLMQQRQAEVAAGTAHVTSVRSNRLPSLTFQDQFDLGTNNSLQGSYLTFGMLPSTPGNNNSPVQNNKLNANNSALSFLQWEFYNFGYYRAQQKEAMAQLAVNEAAFGSDKYVLTESIISLYLDWLKKYRLMEIQNENVQRAQVILNAIRANVNSGLKPGVDSSTASASYSDARIAYLQSADEFTSDKISMASYVGAAPENLAPDSSFISSLFAQSPSIGTPVASVPADHPLLGVYEKQYEQQLADNNTVSKKYMPHLALDGATWVRNSGISYAGVYPESPLDGLPYSKYNYLFGVTATYNLFDLKHRHDELAEGRYAAQARQSALQNQQLSLNTMMLQANATYAATQEKLKEIPVELSSARQAYGQQMALYKAGLNTLVDVTNAQYVLLQAETNYVVMQDQLLQLLYIRAGLSGQLDTFLQNFKR